MTKLVKYTLSAIVGFFIYLRVVRPRQMHWGATPEEIKRSLPGDDLVENPNFVATRAVTIAARPEDIWPWLLQIGSKRAGWYSIDWVDNAGVPSAKNILPEFQHIAAEDFIPFTPDGKTGMWVKTFETNRSILWWDKKEEATWLWWLEPVDEQHTRLITRNRVSYRWTYPWVLYYLLFDVGDIVMMSKCLLGIKQRAEQLQPVAA